MSAPRPAAPSKPLSVFFFYADEDEGLRDELGKHLSILKHRGRIRTGHDRSITAGSEWAGEIDENLTAAEIILLLVSPDFVPSDYCWDVEMDQVLMCHETGQARVLPIILRPVDWREALFGKLQALPKGGQPVTSGRIRTKRPQDVAKGLRAVIEEISSRDKSESARDKRLEAVGEVNEGEAATGNWRIATIPEKNLVQPPPSATASTPSATRRLVREPSVSRPEPEKKTGDPDKAPARSSRTRHGQIGERPLL